MKVKTFFTRMHTILYEVQSGVVSSQITPNQAKRAGEDLHQLFEFFRPYLEDDMIVAVKDLEHK